MRRIAIFAAIFWGVAVLEGCGSSDTPAPENQAQAQPKAPPVPPEVVTREFLEAVRTGDHVKADSLLTDLAEKTKQVDLVLAPSASQTAKYEVGEQEIIEGQVAHVESFWTDIGDDGKPRTIPFVWALRLDTNGWRIGGVASKLFDDVPLLLLNFEDPADMLHKQEQLEAEMIRRMNGGTAAGGTVAGGTAPGTARRATRRREWAALCRTNCQRATERCAPGAAARRICPGAGCPSARCLPALAVTGSLMPPRRRAGPVHSPLGPRSNGFPPGSIVPAGGFSATTPGTVQPMGGEHCRHPDFCRLEPVSSRSPRNGPLARKFFRRRKSFVDSSRKKPANFGSRAS